MYVYVRMSVQMKVVNYGCGTGVVFVVTCRCTQGFIVTLLYCMFNTLYR